MHDPTSLHSAVSQVLLPRKPSKRINVDIEFWVHVTNSPPILGQLSTQNININIEMAPGIQAEVNK